jgi:anti-sigma factor RsiW
MHVHDDLLRRFVDGALDDEVAASVAIHLDACSRCATRAATLEPLALAFAAVDDPIVPADLPHNILAAIHAPPVPLVEPTLGAELALALALAAAAALLVVVTGDGPALMVDAAAAMGGASAAFGALSLGPRGARRGAPRTQPRRGAVDGPRRHARSARARV